MGFSQLLMVCAADRHVRLFTCWLTDYLPAVADVGGARIVGGIVMAYWHGRGSGPAANRHTIQHGQMPRCPARRQRPCTALCADQFGG
jgi:hypothetical protein